MSAQKPQPSSTVMPHVWPQDTNELKEKQGALVSGDSKRIAKECHFTMNTSTLAALKKFVKEEVDKQLNTHKEASEVKDTTSIANLKATTKVLNLHFDKTIEQLNLMKSATGDTVLNGFTRNDPENGKKLIDLTKKNQKVLEDLVSQARKQSDDLALKMNIFITGRSGVLMGNSDFERTKKDRYLGIIAVPDQGFSGSLYIPQVFGEPKVISGSIIEINSKKREYIISYIDGKKVSRKTVTKICEELPNNIITV